MADLKTYEKKRKSISGSMNQVVPSISQVPFADEVGAFKVSKKRKSVNVGESSQKSPMKKLPRVDASKKSPSNKSKKSSLKKSKKQISPSKKSKKSTSQSCETQCTFGFTSYFDRVQAYTIFDENMRSAMADNEELLSLKNIETVFFPIVSFEHYYLVVFKLRRVAFNIIDNSAACSDYDVKYKAVCSVVHRLFSQYLTTHGHAKASSIRRAKPSILKMKWRTRNNFVDCGVFLMCHMDTYLGQPLSKWDPGFVTEETTGKVTQTLKINKLRGKYCTKILLHDSNIHKSKMLAYAKDFEEKYDIRARKKSFDDAISCHIHVIRV